MSILSRFRSRPEAGRTEPSRPGPRRLTVDWRHIPAAEVDHHPDLVHRLLGRSPDGATIAGLFTPEEIERALPHLRADESVRMVFPNGTLLGRPVAYHGPEDDYRGAYLDEAEVCRAVFTDAFGFDPHERIAAALAAMSSFDRFEAPCERGRPYNPGHVRFWEPGMGGLPAHIGNEFAEAQRDWGMKHMLTTTTVIDHLSYFVVLQRPDEGGSMSVFDLVQEEFTSDVPWGDGDRIEAEVDRYPALDVDPEPGDLILFGGGWRWHRIEPIQGTRPRISYGGFCSPSVEGNDLHFWC